MTGVCSMATQLPAWVVSDPDCERSEVVYAKTERAARNRGAGMLDYCDDMKELNVDRAPHFDDFFPNGPRIEALLDAGWRFECEACGRFVYGEQQPHIDGRSVYCSYTEYLQDQKCKAAEKAARDRLIAITRDWFGPEISNVKAWVNHASRGVVQFRFPGCQMSAQWVVGAETAMVSGLDQAAWVTWRRRAKAEEMERRLAEWPQVWRLA